MATVRGIEVGGININKQEIERIVNRSLEIEITRYTSAGERAMLDLRRGAVNKWYGNGESHTINTATVLDPTTQKTVNGITTLYISSHVDLGLFAAVSEANNNRSHYGNAYGSIMGWVERHSKPWTYYNKQPSENNPLRDPLDIPWSPSEYILYLMWDLGIHGLPESATFTGTGWTNTHFNKKDPLELVTIDFFKKHWAKKVNEYVKR